MLERGGALVQDHDHARALHCRRRAGPRQHRLAVGVAALLTRPGLQAVELAAKAVAVWVHSHQKDAPNRVAAQETELWRPSHRSMLRLLTVDAAEHREAHCAAASSLCLNQPTHRTTAHYNTQNDCTLCVLSGTHAYQA